MKKAFWVVLFACAFFAGAGVSQAGTGYEVTCKDPKCAFKAHCGIGGGMAFEEAAGYCAQCKEWVTVTWKRGGKAPLPFVKFWDPKTGEIRRLYKCPKCKKPFIVIEKIEDIKFCPSCKQPSLQYKETVLYD